MNQDARPDAWRYRRRLVIICAIMALLLFGVVSVVPSRSFGDLETGRAVYYGLLAIFVALALAASRKRLTLIAAELSVWLMILMVLVAGYGYRFELQDLAHRVRTELVPAHGTEITPGVVSFTRAHDGQFWIDAEVDGRPVHFLVDTGASGVVLSRADAARLGYSNLSFSLEADTANGRTREAPVTLGLLRIGSIRFTQVPAAVSPGGLHDSLLGMHLLEQLSSIEIRKDTLTIRE
jgi:aspartyl protease family protein